MRRLVLRRPWHQHVFTLTQATGAFQGNGKKVPRCTLSATMSLFFHARASEVSQKSRYPGARSRFIRYASVAGACAGVGVWAETNEPTAFCASSKKNEDDPFEQAKEKLHALSKVARAYVVAHLPDDAHKWPQHVDAWVDATRAGQLSRGFYVGACAGVALKKMLKLGALAIGALVVLLQSASYAGYVSVDYKKLERDCQKYLERKQDGVVDTQDVDSLYHSVRKVLELNLPVGSGFALGLLFSSPDYDLYHTLPKGATANLLLQATFSYIPPRHYLVSRQDYRRRLVAEHSERLGRGIRTGVRERLRRATERKERARAVAGIRARDRRHGLVVRRGTVPLELPRAIKDVHLPNHEAHEDQDLEPDNGKGHTLAKIIGNALGKARGTREEEETEKERRDLDNNDKARRLLDKRRGVRLFHLHVHQKRNVERNQDNDLPQPLDPDHARGHATEQRQEELGGKEKATFKAMLVIEWAVPIVEFLIEVIFRPEIPELVFIVLDDNNAIENRAKRNAHERQDGQEEAQVNRAMVNARADLVHARGPHDVLREN
ncbi:hypothetical protein PsorP6_011113 [Peronosclerospora sorghi]|uniref:Uncharacterized protein n=1 Tax=Peronosclerospora sorghi TaxID=230839 RepID=A0ACC0VWF4_9STRA|nr:hypothetical protein PsorP6_011113 [Peronosclerospora sorghi]